MSKVLFFASVILICSTQVEAQLLSSCATAHGDLVHSVSNVNGTPVGRFNFPSFRDFTLDPSGRTRVLNAPLTNDPVFSDRLNFLKNKNNFLSQIFGEKHSLVVDFNSCELQKSSDKTLSARFCVRSEPIEINGLKIRRIEFSLQNQFRNFLVGSQGEVGQSEVVYAELAFTTETSASGKAFLYKSSYTYHPDGNTTQCSLDPSLYKKEESVPELLK